MGMTQTNDDQASDCDTALTFDVTFTFSQPWSMDPQDDESVAAGKERRVHPHLRVPPGGGLHARKIVIGPVHLKGLSPAEVVEVSRRRAELLALLSAAITAADVEYSEALNQYTGGASAPGQGLT